MNKAARTVNPHLKQQIRAEIESQVRDFLARGGQIRTVQDQRNERAKPCATAWQSAPVLGELFE